ncbi:hypothetical protein CEXT_147441 [Caerostris extrusa]|uniref:Uncharacterized protein n=1 Tax=Caerostris extrusa TaxID=172846 RepID=A0AAV4PYC7_CAEEX|nr:hypothetical protein CEXT_147441 [Caerostris extrusa]
MNVPRSTLDCLYFSNVRKTRDVVTKVLFGVSCRQYASERNLDVAAIPEYKRLRWCVVLGVESLETIYETLLRCSVLVMLNFSRQKI